MEGMLQVPQDFWRTLVRPPILSISHSCSISVMSFCRLAWKEKMVKVVEVLIDQVQGGVWRE